MDKQLNARLKAALGAPVADSGPLSGGCVGEVHRARLEDGREVVVKVERGAEGRLDVEGYMLEYLAAHGPLPVPAVLHGEADLLVMEFLPGDSHFTAAAERHAADLLAACHAVQGAAHGLERDTLIGGLRQPNAQNESWVAFFREQRLLHMAEAAIAAKRIPKPMFARVQSFAARLDEFIEEPAHPSLLHGDVWTTNVLAQGERITGFLDPAVYYGHPEIELAFITLFSTFGGPFFQRYEALRPISPGFFETRRDIYNLYPLLVHVRLFGGGYLRGVETTLSRLGF